MPPPIHLAPPLSASLTERTLINSYITPEGGEVETAPTPQPRGLSGDTFIMQRWCAVLSGVWETRPQAQSKAGRWEARAAWLPSRPAVLFWLGFIAPFCWLIGGWLVPEGRWDMHHVPQRRAGAGPVLPLWRAADGRVQDSAGNEVTMEGGFGRRWRMLWGSPKGPWLERGRGKRTRLQMPEEPLFKRWEDYAARHHPDGPRQKLSRVLLYQLGPEAWVLRCRVAAVISGAALLVAFVVALVVAVHLVRS
ncbi:hypothetical protein K488DRAFT_86755 [Vararia minispora EC-137]|uniref:Uncharacterized protein n=1 Tax=Vararia minispora EC-137 TaxID=1314806 RepID=A0ACB8QIS9_9AGAM|nr:hypothetical protein K488DRAFT_86755 [Vararia minispora EC-137]